MSHASAAPPPMDPAKTPVGPGLIALIGAVLAALVIALGVLAIRDALVLAGLVKGTAWVELVRAALDGLTPAGWALPVGLVLLLLGVWLALAALMPRPPTAIPVQSRTGVFLRRRDVRRLAEAAAEHVDGVLSAHAETRRRTVVVRLRDTGDEGVADRVRVAVSDRLAPLTAPPTVIVKTNGAPR